MKLHELIHEPTLAVRTQRALEGMDWNFDLDATDELRMDRGQKKLKEIERLIGALHTAKPDVAQNMWETHCPWARPGSLPLGVLRR